MIKHLHCCIGILLVCMLCSVYSQARKVSQSESVPVDIAAGLQNIEVTDNVSAQQLWEALCDSVPPGVTITSVAHPGASGSWVFNMCGTYRNIPPVDGVQMKDGIVLTSGLADNCIGPNASGSTTFAGGYPGDQDISAIVGTQTYDVVALEIKFTSDSTVPGFSFTFCYGTEEWKEYVGSQFNDAFICLYDGQNICFDIEGNLVCINNALFAVDNLDNHINLEYDGFTGTLRTSRTIAPGSHTIKLFVCDAGDAILDAGVFLSSFNFEANQNGTYPVVNILGPQVFEISENAQPQTKVGTITNLCKYGPITLAEMTDIPEFHLNGWDIIVSDGAVFDAGQQDTYVIPVIATLDTVWIGGDSWIEHDTADITIKITATDAHPEYSDNKPFSVPAVSVSAEKITVTLPIAARQKVTARLFDVSGRCVRSITAYAQTGTRTVHLSTHGLPCGSYICRIQASSVYTHDIRIMHFK